VDFWWNDGYRGERAGLIGQQVMNKLSFEEVDTPEHRGMLLARYGGVGSHRYGGFFTGDTSICWEVLAMQVEFDIRAGHLGLAYVSHDIGGFCTGGRIEIIDPELYLRWVQFGVFNPLLRFHSAPSSGSRQPWDYDPHLRGAARRWLRLRNSLLPYIYSAAREHYETGLPLVRGLFLEAPETPAAYRFDEYLFGPSFLCAPVTGPERRREVYLPAGEWYEYDTGKPVAGGRSFNRRVAVDRMPVYARAGSIIPRQDPDREELHAPHLDPLWLDVFPGAAGEAVLYEDDGVSGRYRGSRFCKTRLRLARRGKTLTLSGEKAAGRPFGATRRLRVRVPLAERPSAVRLDGRKLPDAAVEQERKGWVCIDVPAVKAGGSFKLTVTPRTESR
jgi:alpha-glucosidase (family GH31 glycosyl hydrolase)